MHNIFYIHIGIRWYAMVYDSIHTKVKINNHNLKNWNVLLQLNDIDGYIFLTERDNSILESITQ